LVGLSYRREKGGEAWGWEKRRIKYYHSGPTRRLLDLDKERWAKIGVSISRQLGGSKRVGGALDPIPLDQGLEEGRISNN